MSDETTGDHPKDAKHALATRLRALRLALHGEHGGPAMARLLGLPNRTWLDCETGEAIPGEVLVLLVERTEVSPTWLLSGSEPMLRPRADGAARREPHRSDDGRPTAYAPREADSTESVGSSPSPPTSPEGP